MSNQVQKSISIDWRRFLTLHGTCNQRCVVASPHCTCDTSITSVFTILLANFGLAAKHCLANSMNRLAVCPTVSLSVCLPVSFPVAVPVSRGCNVSEWTVTIDVGRINFTFNENVIELSSLYGLHAMTAIGKEKKGRREEGGAAGVSQVRRSCCTLPGQLAA